MEFQKCVSLYLFLLLICFPNFISAYKILVLILTPATSHYNQGKGVANILHEKGHNVTFLTCYESKNAPYRTIVIPEVAENDMDIDFEDELNQSFLRKCLSVTLDIQFSKMSVENAFKSEKLLKFINNKEESFDLIIMDYILNDIYIGLSIKYDCPVIILAAAQVGHRLARSTGNTVSPATIPDVYLDFTNQMTLFDRALNAIGIFLQEIIGYFICRNLHEEEYKKYFPEEAKMVEYPDLMKRVSMVMAISYPSLNYPRPYLPNIVEVGGFHVNKPEPLNKEYKDVLDNAEDGVIFFSLGSYLKTHTLPKHVIDIFLRSLSKLKQTVLWKFESELENVPKNVIIKKWMPQPGILAHPNCKLFITHGGVLSIIEAALAGVPLVAIPVFGDQYYNAKMAIAANIGKLLTFNQLTEESFDSILQELLNNQTYTENAKNLKKLYLDRPMSAQDAVNYYAEYVIRNKGAKHLTPPYVDTFTYLLLDIIGIFLVSLLAIFGLLFYICRRLCRSEKKTKKQKKQ